ncbi:MAG: DNA polymerase III [Sulfobacillus benefaciens]|uniref:DNA 5'-3' helicase n=1 Tax=Sulfobacillus benefaciens TaxID=453960 RepID=A0A2T2XDI4_9FIRM|nr:MAG: DNA polymerase III [Sulfobacillus benefaciens]
MKLPGFESRPSQNAMVEAIESAMRADRILMVEAGTGTGKSLAYLTPAILHVAAEGQRTVVATHTLALQEQLWAKDLPWAMGDSPMSSAVLKGRGRYLCLLKLDEQKQDVTILNSPRPERYGLAQIITFGFWSVNGDIDEFNPRTDVVRRLWQNVVAERNACAGSRCAFAEPCFLRQSKRLAEASHIVVVNHALLATHLKQGGVLPAFTHLIIDEAHHFAEVMERTLGMELDIFNFVREFEEMDQGRQGLFQRLPQHADTLSGIDAVRRNMRVVTELLWQLNHELILQFPSTAETRSSMRVTSELWDRWQGETLGKILSHICQTLDEVVHQAHDVLAQAEAIWGDVVHEEVSWLRYGKWLTDIFELAQQLEEWGHPNQDWVSWWEVSRQTPQLTLRLKRAPLDVGNFLHSHLWDGLPSGVVTSATLSIRGNFEYYQNRLGIPKTRLETLSLPTPFDVPHMAQLLVPNDMPEVTQPAYASAVSDFTVAAASALGGRTLVLFTSYRMMHEVNRDIRGPLLDRNIQLLAQGIDGTGPRLVEQFRGHPSAVLMGTASLWEGVDIPGAQLSLVIIVRLPFANPMDPMEEAIRERLGRFAFNQHTLPQALLRFKQGFGRLLRTTTDKGAVVVLDPRILPNRTQYGRRFVATLPDPPMVSAPWPTIIQMIRQMSEST